MASGWVTSLSSETTPTLAFLLHFRVGFSLLVSVAPVSMLTILRRQLFMCSTGLCSNFSCNSEKKTRYLVKLICISSRKGKQNWRIVDQYFSNGIHCNSLIKTLFFLHLQMNVRRRGWSEWDCNCNWILIHWCIYSFIVSPIYRYLLLA